MTAKTNVVTQLHINTDLISVQKFKPCVHIFAAVHTSEYCRKAWSDNLERQRVALTKLSNSGFDENKGFSART